VVLRVARERRAAEPVVTVGDPADRLAPIEEEA
jgi:hypothetical protein